MIDDEVTWQDEAILEYTGWLILNERKIFNKINELISKLTALLPNHYKKILNKMGFSNDWENIMLEIIK